MLLSSNSAAMAASYTVKAGDSLFLIGQRFGVSAQQIQSANNIASTEIRPGQILSIPSSNTSNTCTVKPGDTLYLIAQRYGITYQQLMSLNGLSTASIKPGQTLALPSQATSQGGSSRQVLASRGAFSRDDITLLARTVYSEARGEPYTGQVAVASVVLNRLEHPDFPNTIRGVIFEPLAFTAVADGQFWLNPSQTAYSAVNDALNGWDPSNGALYYWNPVTATSRWIWSRAVTHQIGQHVFGH